MSQNTPRDDGFTLIETLIAMVIFLIGSLAMVSLMLAVIHTNRNSYTLTEAVTAGRTEMERILSNPDPTTPNPCAPGTCTDFAGCTTTTPLCAREVVVRGTQPGTEAGAMRFQVINERTLNGGLSLITVRVRWPRDEDKRGLPTTSPEYVDCVATPGECKTLIFNGQK